MCGFHTTPKVVVSRTITLLLNVFALLSAFVVSLKTWVRAVQEDWQQVYGLRSRKRLRNISAEALYTQSLNSGETF